MVGRDPGIKDLGEIGTIHDRECLALGLESPQRRQLVHSGFDELEGDATPNRLELIGDPNLAHAAFADPLEQLVPPGDDRTNSIPWG